MSPISFIFVFIGFIFLALYFIWMSIKTYQWGKSEGYNQAKTEYQETTELSKYLARELAAQVKEFEEFLESEGYEACCYCRESGEQTWMKSDEVVHRATGDDVYGAMCEDCYAGALNDMEVKS